MRLVVSSAMSRRRSLGMMMRVSTCSLRMLTPSIAESVRRRPSQTNGLVTMATERMPSLRAMAATTGAPPVPVPPPMPAVMKTMS